jgi:hypothetical protein
MRTQPTGINVAIVVPWILTLATALVGIWQFTVQQSQGNRQPFLQKQLELAFQASETTSRLATVTDPADWEKARLNFWVLYWGPLSVVEDPRVEQAMVDIGKLVPPDPQSNPKLPMRALEVPSYNLAHALRDLVLTSWNVNLPPLQNKRPGAQ